MPGNPSKASDIDYNGAQNQAKPRSQTRGTAQLAAGVHLLPTGGIFKSAAVEVLRREQRLMATGEICKLALEWGLLKCSGKTPEATMASSLYGDIKRNDGGGMFFRPRGGMFGLKEWIELGIFPSDALLPPTSQQLTIKRAADTLQSGQKEGKKQRKSTSPSNAPPAKRVQQVQGGEGAAAGRVEIGVMTEYKNLETQTRNANMSMDQPAGLQHGSWQHINNNTLLVESSRTPVMAATITAEQPRRRLLTSDTNEVETSGAIAQKSSVPANTADADAPAATRQDWARYVVAEQEKKVLAVENKWGSLHPRTGQAHLLLYKSCKQHAIRFPSVESRAQTALTRAYDIMMFNSQVEELGKLQGLW